MPLLKFYKVGLWCRWGKPRAHIPLCLILPFNIIKGLSGCSGIGSSKPRICGITSMALLRCIPSWSENNAESVGIGRNRAGIGWKSNTESGQTVIRIYGKQGSAAAVALHFRTSEMNGSSTTSAEAPRCLNNMCSPFWICSIQTKLRHHVRCEGGSWQR